jgi:hypothetical protein
MVLQWRSDLPKPYPAAERLQQNGAPCTGSNLRPAAYKAAALPTELTEHGPGTDCSGHTTRAPGQCRQKQDKRPRHRTARCRWPVLDVHDVKQQSLITHACTHADAFAARAVADAAARTRLTKSIVWMLRVWFGPSFTLSPLGGGFFSALPPVSPVFLNPLRVGLSRVSPATPRTNAYAANRPVDRTTGRRRSARRYMSASNAWLPRLREKQHSRKIGKIQLGLPISREHRGARSEKTTPVAKDSLSAFASRRRFRSFFARARTFYCYFMRARQKPLRSGHGLSSALVLASASRRKCGCAYFADSPNRHAGITLSSGAAARSAAVDTAGGFQVSVVVREENAVENRGAVAGHGEVLARYRYLREVGKPHDQAPGQQLDLFSHAAVDVEQSLPQGTRLPLAAVDMDDAALIALIPESSFADSAALAAEAGRRQLAAAVPALTALVRRFAGFGLGRTVPEQAAALQGLAMIGGRDAAHAVAEIIGRAVVQGPTLRVALSAAVQLRSTLSVDVLRSLLRHAEPGIRADACRCARPLPELIALLIDLLDDLDRTVARSAACALGQMGRIEARPMLKRLLREEPSEDVIDSVSSIADEECVVLLGRIAQSTPSLADAALESLDSIDHPRAAALAAAIRHPRTAAATGKPV